MFSDIVLIVVSGTGTDWMPKTAPFLPRVLIFLVTSDYGDTV